MKQMKFLNLRWILIVLALSVIQAPAIAQYYTGQRVFSSKFPAETKDYQQDTYVKIENTSGDIIVAIENVRTGKTIQHAYILSTDDYEFKYIPVGRYVCKYMWTDPITGRRMFEKDNSYMEFKPDESGGYVITLQETEYGNLDQSRIDEDDFFQ